MGWRRFWRRGRRDDELARSSSRTSSTRPIAGAPTATSPDDARDAAMRKLGNPTRVREKVYDANSVPILEAIVKDVRYALRMLRPARASPSPRSCRSRSASAPTPRSFSCSTPSVCAACRSHGPTSWSKSSSMAAIAATACPRSIRQPHQPAVGGTARRQQAFAGMFAWGIAGCRSVVAKTFSWPEASG